MAGLPKNGKSGPHFWRREGSTQFAHQFVTASPLVGCVVWSRAGLRELEALGEALGEVNLVAPNEIEK